MPKYYCHYCDTHLTHDSPSVRKTHNGGRKHKDSVRMYYQQWMEEQAQKLVDAAAKAYKEGKMPGIAPPGMMTRPPMGAMIPPPGAYGRGMPPVPMINRPGMPAFPGMPPMPYMIPPMPVPGVPRPPLLPMSAIPQRPVTTNPG